MERIDYRFRNLKYIISRLDTAYLHNVISFNAYTRSLSVISRKVKQVDKELWDRAHQRAHQMS